MHRTPAMLPDFQREISPLSLSPDATQDEETKNEDQEDEAAQLWMTCEGTPSRPNTSARKNTRRNT